MMDLGIRMQGRDTPLIALQTKTTGYKMRLIF